MLFQDTPAAVDVAQTTEISSTPPTIDDALGFLDNAQNWIREDGLDLLTNPTRRVDPVFGIGYGDDISKAKALLKDICAADARVLADPETTIGVLELGDNAVNIVCRPWVNSGDYWPTHFDLLEKVKMEFDAAGINFPYPQQDVHMHNVS